MKNFGCTFEYEKERNEDLMRAYHEDISKCKYIHLKDVWRRISCMPSSRFWVSEERAAIVVGKMMRGDNIAGMRPLKREMFAEIFRRVQLIQKEHTDYSIYKCTFFAVNSPAPKFYMTPLSIRVTIYKIRRDWKKKKSMRV